ncbi:MAG: allophanate hydrolase subunit 1 [Actinomycetota bacterium]|nr:allophanate hydrolase subunit 1 [Actinomycetota bacterium]
MRVLRCGLDAVLVELAGLDQVLGLRAALRTTCPDGVAELVPAARTLLIRYDPRRLDLGRIRALLAELPAAEAIQECPGELVVPVRYDGADLAEVAALTGLTRREVTDRHLGSRFTVAFCGFAPGFAYLTGLDPALWVPRRTNPRTLVPAGSVAVADEYTGVYPRPSPGGWQLIGSTELAVWNLARDPVTLLPPGTTVRFEEVGG